MLKPALDLDELPAVAVDTQRVQPLLPYGLRFNRLLPYRDETLLDSQFPFDEGPIPWTLELEIQYLQFHPSVWDLLEADDETDRRYRDDVLAELSTLKRSEDLSTGERYAKLQDAFYRVCMRLHDVRKRFYQQEAASHPEWTAARVQASIASSSTFVKPNAPMFSLWPFIKPDPSPLLAPKVIRITHLTIQQYKLPDFKTAASQQAHDQTFLSAPKKEDRTAFERCNTPSAEDASKPASNPIPETFRTLSHSKVFGMVTISADALWDGPDKVKAQQIKVGNDEIALEVVQNQHILAFLFSLARLPSGSLMYAGRRE
ncbi:uncharacterized protein RHTO_06987 [Rhodotorula toruloides NP11]|uniref:Uncharacterized protein n=1 Tax=Rhodotorula toruloides (strain NP11) TaxID=1130832 RepID=M7XUK8_RHOT1|nr:uncharacterized protein RHTO_06987 [Rhodotorula toruloides NP11]EMS23928.1 hypothetical protein RHTO_06987 [Rhodotorula toruloides NP11]